MRPLILATIAVVLIAAAGIWYGAGESGAQSGSAAAPTMVAAGEALFDANCAVCHGSAGTGTNQGPPLVHIIYEPSHHGDMSFLMAAQNGVRAHHWQFGNMPPVEGVSEDDVAAIVTYIRSLQREAGIF
ncbi:c-type cytochrome [Rhodobacterales bacterium HKCCE3408]|nr:c-type cytochrome [Rhodobacterales bacterium HKCCE3408]